MDTTAFVVVAVVLAVVLWVLFYTVNPAPTGAPPTGRALSSFTEDTQGVLVPADLSGCVQGTESTCFYDNPSSPYTSIKFKEKAPGTTGLAAQLAVATFRLASTASLFVLEGVTPPECAYWGYTLYLLNKPETCGLKVLFASLTDTVNNISTGLGFQQPITIAFGCNREVLAAYRAEHPEAVLVPFPYQGADSHLYLLGRSALYASATAQASYLKNTQTVGRVLTYTGPLSPLANVLEPALTPRNQEGNERLSSGTYDLQAEAFLARVQAEAGRAYAYVQEVPVQPFLSSIQYDSGYDCIQNCENCLHDNRDTTYFTSYVPYPLQEGKTLLAVFGVNHSTTGKSIYTSVTLYNADSFAALKDFVYVDTDPDTYGIVVGNTSTGSVSKSTAQLYATPASVTKVDIAERAYVQLPGSVSAAPETLYPMRVWVLSTTPL
jgi:hypothetical protein